MNNQNGYTTQRVPTMLKAITDLETSLRSLKQDIASSDSFFEGIQLDTAARFVRYLDQNGKPTRVRLTPSEFSILHVLTSNPDRVFSRDNLLELVWGTNTFVEARTVDKHISSLRTKIGHASRYIVTVTSIGYVFSPSGA